MNEEIKHIDLQSEYYTSLTSRYGSRIPLSERGAILGVEFVRSMKRTSKEIFVNSSR